MPPAIGDNASSSLRLEYYEGFSRFFSGNGRAFLPLQSGVK
jgi:vacuolar-type H+-ATPase subunit I/STV1